MPCAICLWWLAGCSTSTCNKLAFTNFEDRFFLIMMEILTSQDAAPLASPFRRQSEILRQLHLQLIWKEECAPCAKFRFDGVFICSTSINNLISRNITSAIWFLYSCLEFFCMEQPRHKIVSHIWARGWGHHHLCWLGCNLQNRRVPQIKMHSVFNHQWYWRDESFLS